METLLAAKSAVIILVFVALFCAERMFRAASPPRSPARLFRNGGLWLTVLILSPVLVAPATAFGANHLLWARPESLTTGASGILALIVDLVLLDLWVYWLHRAYHKVPLMWRLHEVHHRDEFLDTTSAVRFHIGEVLLSASLRIAPITVLAVPLSSVIIFETLLLSAALFHHSNVRLPARLETLLSRIIVTPSIHWVHHHAVRADTDSSYATILSLWDPLFRSRSATKRDINMKIGAEGVEDLGFFSLLLSPFYRKKE